MKATLPPHGKATNRKENNGRKNVAITSSSKEAKPLESKLPVFSVKTRHH